MAAFMLKGKPVLVSDEDADLLGRGWNLMVVGYAIESKRIGRRYLHRIVADRMGILADGLEVDHMNGNKLDNRRENLRAVTHAHNLQNRGPNANSKTGIRGVWWSAAKNGYVAEVHWTDPDGRTRKKTRVCRTIEEATVVVVELRADHHPGAIDGSAKRED